MRFRAILAVLALFSGTREASAQTDAELFIANYSVSFVQQFAGKVVRGGNVWRAFRQTSYEAVSSATLQYAGMRMAGENWRLALPAQVLVQKGAEIQRRSIMGQPVFSRDRKSVV